MVCYGGATFHREFRWRPAGAAPQDFTGWSAQMLIGVQRGKALKELNTDNGGIQLTDDGMIILELAAADTDDLKVSNLFYSLDLIDPDGKVTRFMRGRVSVVRDVQPVERLQSPEPPRRAPAQPTLLPHQRTGGADQ